MFIKKIIYSLLFKYFLFATSKNLLINSLTFSSTNLEYALIFINSFFFIKINANIMIINI